MVNSTGSVFLNGAQLSNSNAFVAGDIVRYRANQRKTASAAINGPGASIAVEPNSILRFQGQSFPWIVGRFPSLPETGRA